MTQQNKDEEIQDKTLVTLSITIPVELTSDTKLHYILRKIINEFKEYDSLPEELICEVLKSEITRREIILNKK